MKKGAMQIQYQKGKNMHRDKSNVTLWLFVVFFAVMCAGPGFIWNRAVNADVYMNDFHPGNVAYRLQYDEGTLPEIRSMHFDPNPVQKMRANGEYVVSVFRNGTWQKAGDLSYDRFYRTREMELSLSSDQKRLRVKIEKQNGGASHMDCVLLNGRPPVWTNDDIDKISLKDFDVINTKGKVVELAFDTEGFSQEAVLSLTGRIEGTRISKVPFQYPGINTFRPMNEGSAFYTYRLGTNDGALNPDGDLSEEKLGRPFFAEYIPVGSGHPQGTTYGWVENDDKNLYVAMDFTSDNTMDGNEDYTKVYAKTPDGLKEFRVSMDDRKWGIPGFTYTDRVSYQHKVYEYAIPLRELGIGAGNTTGNTIQLAFAAYGTASAGDYEPCVAYDSNHNRYLTVYQNFDAVNYYIYGIFLDTSGNLIGDPFVICSDVSAKYDPSIAFDFVNSRFLVAWVDERSGGSYDIYGQLINADGTLYGTTADTNFAISTAASDQNNPSVAFDPANSRFLVAWHDYRSGGNNDIYGQLVNADGSLYKTTADTNFAVCNETSDQNSPSVAFDPANSRFLVAWHDYRSGGNNDIYGQLVNADGSLFKTAADTNFVISNATGEKIVPSAAFDSLNGRFLVAWEDLRDASADIYGQIVNTDSSLYKTAAGTNFVISNATGEQIVPSAAFDSLNDRFLVAWDDARSGDDIYGQIVNADGSLYNTAADTNFAVDTSANVQRYPTVASNPFYGNYLTAYEDTDGAGSYFITISAVGTPNPAQGLLTFPIGMDSGLTPETGSVGDTFTFKVYYWGKGAPKTAELWVDLDGDGSYTAGLSFPVIPVPPNMKIMAIIVTALFGMAGALVLGIGRRRPVFRAVSSILFSIFIAASIFTGCSSGSKEEPVSERFSMTEADTSDTNYLDGKLYTLSSTLDITVSGSYTYKCMFNDWNGSASIGAPAEERVITIK